MWTGRLAIIDIPVAPAEIIVRHTTTTVIHLRLTVPAATVMKTTAITVPVTQITTATTETITVTLVPEEIIGIVLLSTITILAHIAATAAALTAEDAPEEAPAEDVINNAASIA